MGASGDFEAAVAAALEAAKALKADLVRRGVIREEKKCMPGVTWYSSKGIWRVELPGAARRQATVKPLDDSPVEIERARLKAEAMLLEAKEAARSQPGRPFYVSGRNGLSWNSGTQRWLAQPFVNGQRIKKTFKPADASPAEVEKARLKGVAFLDRLERAAG